MKSIKDIVYSTVDGEDLKFDLYTPDEGAFDIFVYFHGGGLEKGSKESGSTSFVPYLAERGIATASFDYRMYPTYKYPDFLVDAANGIKYVIDHKSEWGDCRRIFVGGSSAGGYMSMMLCFDKRWYEGAGVDRERIAGYVHDAGQPTAHFNVLKFSGVDPRRVIVDDTAPLYHIGTDKEYPPMTFIVSDDDMQNRYEQTMLVLSTLKHFGHTEPKVTHTVMNGKHCKYVGRIDEEDGKSAFGKLVEAFVASINGGIL